MSGKTGNVGMDLPWIEHICAAGHGQYVQPKVFAKKVRGVLKFAVPIVLNVWLDA